MAARQRPAMSFPKPTAPAVREPERPPGGAIAERFALAGRSQGDHVLRRARRVGANPCAGDPAEAYHASYARRACDAIPRRAGAVTLGQKDLDVALAGVTKLAGGLEEAYTLIGSSVRSA